jgi:hypothetical protein
MEGLGDDLPFCMGHATRRNTVEGGLFSNQGPHERVMIRFGCILGERY